MRWARHAVVVAVTLLLLGSLKARAAQDPCAIDALQCTVTQDATYIGGLSRGEVLGLPRFPGDGGSAVVAVRGADAPRYEYRSLNDCDAAEPGSPGQDVSCMRALRSCPPDQGPLMRIWRRTVVAGRVVQPWTAVGVTCHAEVAPGARPTVTMADIVAQFMRTPWAKPHVATEPEGDTTLVNLTTFFRVEWSAQGFAPGEVDQSVLRGVAVRIRPRLVGFVYVFGDGRSQGPTTSAGGSYPDGEVRHRYLEPGGYQARVNTTFGADFSIDGGRSWDPIPSTVTVPGPSTTVTVKQAQAVLVNQ